MSKDSPNWYVIIFKLTILLVLINIVLGPIINVIHDISQPVKIYFISNYKNDLLFGLLIILLIVYLFFKIFQRKLPTLSSFYFLMGITLSYYFERNLSSFEYYNFYTFQNFKYIDSIYLVVVISFTKWKRITNLKLYKIKKDQIENETKGFYYDAFSTFESEDAFGFNSYCELIANYIKGTKASKSNKSLIIGINGNWGTGKSTFAELISEHLRKDTKSFEVVQLNPWQTNDYRLITNDFFKTLERHIHKYDETLISKLSNYSNDLAQLNKNIWLKLFSDTLSNVFGDSKTMIDQFEDINCHFQRINKKFIIVIDDLDRLSNQETFEIIRLIRNTADFSNIIYIVPYDYTYVSESLNSNQISQSTDSYLKKIFQIDITLPEIKKTIVKDKLRLLLGLDIRKDDEANILKNVIKNLSIDFSDPAPALFGFYPSNNAIEILLENLRDVIRFVNQINLTLDLTKGEVEYRDIFLLELIKSKYFIVYEGIKKGVFLEMDQTNIKVNENDLTKFLSSNVQHGIPDYKHKDIKKVINLLFIPQPQSERPISNRKYFEYYFNFELFDLISINEFNGLEANPDKISEFFKKIKLKNRLPQLIDYISQKASWQSENSLKSALYLLSIISITNRNREAEFFKTFVTLIRYGHNKNEGEQKILFEDYVLNNPFLGDNPVVKARLIYSFLYNVIKENYLESNILLSKKFLQEKLHALFDQYVIEVNGGYDEIVDEIFHYCYESIDPITNSITLTKESIEKFKIIIYKNSEAFISNLIRPYTWPANDHYTFEPYLKQIFTPFPSEFEKMLFNTELKETDCIKVVRNYYKKYKSSGFKEFYLTKSEIESLDAC